MGWLTQLRQAWTGDRAASEAGGHAFVPSRSSEVTCAACGRTMGDGAHDGTVTTNANGFA